MQISKVPSKVSVTSLVYDVTW